MLIFEGVADLVTALTIVNVWDTVGEDQVLKGEYRVISGRVYIRYMLIMMDQITKDAS